MKNYRKCEKINVKVFGIQGTIIPNPKSKIPINMKFWGKNTENDKFSKAIPIIV